MSLRNMDMISLFLIVIGTLIRKKNLRAVVRNQLDGLILQDPSDELDVSELPDLPSVILTSNEVFSAVRNTVSTDTVGA